MSLLDIKHLEKFFAAPPVRRVIANISILLRLFAATVILFIFLVSILQFNETTIVTLMRILRYIAYLFLVFLLIRLFAVVTTERVRRRKLTVTIVKMLLCMLTIIGFMVAESVMQGSFT